MKDLAGCLGALFIVVVNLAWIGLIAWGLVELILFISRH